MLRKVVLIFRLVFLERFAYRLNFALEVAGGILSIRNPRWKASSPRFMFSARNDGPPIVHDRRPVV
jgi:hypothetical protein